MAAAPPESAVREHVVIVDHDVEALRALIAPLRGQFEFHLTISASDALSLLDHRSIAVLVSGQKLFSTSGVELLNDARKRSPRTVRILLADAVERRSIDAAQLDAAGIQVLMKPCTAQQLREVLRVGAWSSTVSKEETGEVEHVVMETAGDKPAEATGIPVTVLTTDADLYESIKTATLGRHEAHLATRLEDATELAATGRCPVLVTDMALAQPALERIARHIGTHEPALVMVVVGNREQGNALMALLGSGVIHRFLLKPVTPGLARLAIDSASRHHQGLLTAPRPPPVTKSRAPSRFAPKPVARAAPPPATEQVDALRHDPHHRSAADSQGDATSQTGNRPAPRFAPSPVLAAEREPPGNRDDATFELTAPLAVQAETALNDAPSEPEPRRRAPWGLIIGGLLVAVAASAGFWWWSTSSSEPPVDTRAQAVQQNLAAALAAYEAGRLIDPPEDSAAYYYDQVLKVDAQNAAAIDGLERIAEGFIQQAESFLVEGKLDEAEAALQGLRRARPEHRRLRFLDTQLRKEQQDKLVLQARESASAGDTRKAQELLARAAQVAAQPNDEVDAAQQSITARERAQLVADEIDLGRRALADGRLITPANDSAQSHFRAAQRADPSNVAAQQGLRDLGERVVAEAGQAIARGQFDTARILIRESQDLGATAAQLATLRASLDAAQGDQQKSNLVDLVIRRSEENRLLEPAQDSARFHLDRLIASDPQHPGIPQAVRALGARLVANAQVAIGQRQLDSAANLLVEARNIGFQGPELVAAETALRTARTATTAPVASSPAPSSPAAPVRSTTASQQPTAAAPTPAASGPTSELAAIAPKRLRASAPEYPKRALEKGEQGWVDVSFAVTPEGDVTDARVEAATPRNVFDRAALSAVRQWQFEQRTAQTAYTQRMKTRVQFKLNEN